MAGYKNFRLIIGIVTALVLTFNAVIFPAVAMAAGSVNETGSVKYIEDDRSALEPAESEFAEKEENTQNDSVGAEEDTQDDKKENIPQEGESGQEADAPSENAGDAASTNQEGQTAFPVLPIQCQKYQSASRNCFLIPPEQVRTLQKLRPILTLLRSASFVGYCSVSERSQMCEAAMFCTPFLLFCLCSNPLLRIQ